MKRETVGGIVCALATSGCLLAIGDIRTLAVILSLSANILWAILFAPERTTQGIVRLFLAYCAVSTAVFMIAIVLMFILFLVFFKKPGG